MGKGNNISNNIKFNLLIFYIMKNFKIGTFLLLLICIVLLFISVSKTKYINSLEKKLSNKETYIEEIVQKTNYEHVDSLYMEIMDLGHKLDSMMLKHD